MSDICFDDFDYDDMTCENCGTRYEFPHECPTCNPTEETDVEEEIFDVLSYLEINNDSRAYLTLLDNFTRPRYLMGGRDFYAQSFHPKLVSELFDGWDFNDDTNLWNEDTEELISLDFFNNTIIIRGLHREPPITLDDFITDCKRAKIKLKWRVI